MLTASQKAAFVALLKKYQQQQASPEEVEFLESYYQYFDHEERMSLQLDPEQLRLLENRIYGHIEESIRQNEKKSEPVRKPVIFLFQKIAASVIFLLLSASAFIYFFSKHSSSKLYQNQSVSRNFSNDLNPGTSTALLTLADGTTITLDTVKNGLLASQGGARILKFNNGTLAYNHPVNAASPKSSDELKYNIISTPRGGQYMVILSDGSKVWLNAASSLRFPASFSGQDRVVELNGEAYFEVAKEYRSAKDKKNPESVPFNVRANGVDISVLGTHFNVNAYSDENDVKTTLLEGAVRVIRGNQFTLLKPGNQSRVDKNGDMQLITSANTEEAVAWKNGLFHFQSADIETIMRQVARWYNVDVEYKGKVNEKFFVELPRNTRASELFKILETTGAVHFEIEKQKVTVLP